VRQRPFKTNTVRLRILTLTVMTFFLPIIMLYRFDWFTQKMAEGGKSPLAFLTAIGKAILSFFRTEEKEYLKMEGKVESVQVFGRKKNATAVAYCKRGNGLIKVNGSPIELVEPETLRIKTYEPVLLLGQQRFANVR
jgi:hypothetical protein